HLAESTVGTGIKQNTQSNNKFRIPVSFNRFQSYCPLSFIQLLFRTSFFLLLFSTRLRHLSISPISQIISCSLLSTLNFHFLERLVLKYIEFVAVEAILESSLPLSSGSTR